MNKDENENVDDTHKEEEAETVKQENLEESQSKVEEEEVLLSPIQRVHVFIYQIYNIIRNVDLLKQYTTIKYEQRSSSIMRPQLSQHSSSLALPPPPPNQQ